MVQGKSICKVFFGLQILKGCIPVPLSVFVSNWAIQADNSINMNMFIKKSVVKHYNFLPMKYI